MQKTEARLYEPPALADIGEFAELTLGQPGGNFEVDWLCFGLC